MWVYIPYENSRVDDCLPSEDEQSWWRKEIRSWRSHGTLESQIWEVKGKKGDLGDANRRWRMNNYNHSRFGRSHKKTEEVRREEGETKCLWKPNLDREWKVWELEW